MDDMASEDWLLEPPNGDSLQLDRHVSQTGYREGIQRGKELSIQEGFDKGFEAGAKRARRLNLLRGSASATLDVLLKQTGNEDARVDRVRQLIRQLNQHTHLPNSDLPAAQDQIEGLANQMNGLMNFSSTQVRPCRSVALSDNKHHQNLTDTQSTLDRCQFELDAILATMNICIQSPGPLMFHNQ